MYNKVEKLITMTLYKMIMSAGIPGQKPYTNPPQPWATFYIHFWAASFYTITFSQEQWDKTTIKCSLVYKARDHLSSIPQTIPLIHWENTTYIMGYFSYHYPISTPISTNLPGMSDIVGLVVGGSVVTPNHNFINLIKLISWQF